MSYWKKKMQDLKAEDDAQDDYWKKKMAELEAETSKVDNIAVDNDIAPLRQDAVDAVLKANGVSKQKQDNGSWFQKSASDNFFKTWLSSSKDLETNVLGGILGMGETAVDAGATIVGAIGGLFNKDFGEQTKEFIAKDLYDEEAVARKIVGWRSPQAWFDKDIMNEENSVFGEKTDSLAQSGGQLLGTYALQSVGVPANLTMGVTSFGSETENAFKQGASYDEAIFSGLVSAGAEILTEKISGGIKFGGTTLDDALTKKLVTGISNKLVRGLAKTGLDMAGEGIEEVVSQFASNLGSALYREENLNDILFSEKAVDEYIDSFIGGAVLGGVSDAGKAVDAKWGSKRDMTSGLTADEEKVFLKEYNDRLAEAQKGGKTLTKKEKSAIYDSVMKDLAEGGIDTDKIESVLGGDAYKAYKDTVDSEEALKKEFAELGKTKTTESTLEMETRYKELKQKVDEMKDGKARTDAKTTLSKSVYDLVKGSKLAESYHEKARRGQKFNADLSKYKGEQAKIVKKAIDSGILNNTRRTHQFVETVSRISADKGVPFDFTNNAKLAASGFAVDGATVNGVYTKDGISINMDSHKAWQSTVGHEITHVLEGTELYTELQNTLFEYAKTKKDFDGRRKNLENLYKNVADANIDAELTADLVGDYLFTDSDFVNHLSAKNRNVFQKVYDEIKHMLKLVTAGSKEARELEKVKYAFDKAYRESGKTQKAETEDKVKYSIVALDDGKVYVDASRNIIKGETVDEMRSDITRFFSDLLGENSSLDIHTIEGDTLTITKGETADKARDNYKTVDGQRIKMTDEEFAVKMHIESHIDEIAEVSKPNGGKDDSKNHSFAKDGFTYRRAYFKDFDGSYYEVTLSIGNNGTVATVYNVGKIKEGVPPSAKILAVVGSKPLGKTPSVDILPQNSKKSSGFGKLSLSDSDGKTLTKEQSEYFKDSKMRDEKGNLKVMHHGSLETFTVFDKKKAKSSGTYGNGFYFTESTSHAGTYGQTLDVYLNITNPLQNGTNDITKDQIRKFVEALAENEDYGIDNYGYDATIDSVTDSVYGKSDFGMIMDLNISCVGNMVEAIELFNKVNGTNYDGIIAPTETVAFYPEQIKRVDNTNPTSDPDIRYSLTEYTAEEKKAHNDMVLQHFGKTYKWAETGYLLLDGTRLDLSGKHDGAPGGYRTVDHRDITEALGYDYGGGDYSGSLVQFMSEGNIRIVPEIDGINLSVKPTKAQEQALSDFISRARGEVVLDIDDLNGNTVVSVEYPRGTYYAKVLNDIREWFDNGKQPEVSGVSAFRSLTKNGVKPKRYGNYSTPLSDLRLQAPVKVVAPIREDAPKATTPVTVPEKVEEAPMPDSTPITEEEANALQMESMESLTDADAPPEVDELYYGESERQSLTMDGSALKRVTAEVKDTLGLDVADTAKMEKTIQKFAEDPDMTESDLFEEIRREYQYTEEVENADETLDLAKKHMRGKRIYVPEELRGDFNGRRADGYNQFRKENLGHFYLTSKADAIGIDQIYGELRELYPDHFPDIWNPADQLQQMSEVASMVSEPTIIGGEYDSDTIQEVVDIIKNRVNKYSQETTERLAEEERQSLLATDDIAPVAEKHEKPTAYETTKKGQVEGQQTMFKESAAPAKEQPIKTVKDRLIHKLHVAYGELSHNKRLRRESLESFNAKIDALQLEYDTKKNKDTKVANEILRRIERLKRLRDEVDADYTKRINDNRANVEKYKAKVEEGYDETEGRTMRADIHAAKIDEIKSKFGESGLDLDETLKNAKNLSTLATVDNTPQRVMEKALGYDAGQALADATVNKVAQNESEGIKWLNAITSRKGDGGLLKKLSKQYHIKPGSKESAAAQMYAEGFYVAENGDIITYGDAELAKDFPDAQKQKNIKGLAGDPRIRQFYDETLAKINESRTRNAYPEIKPLDNYYLHFRAMDDTFSRLGIPFNPNDIRAKDLPTDLNGVTADLKPGQPYFASAMHRRGKKTSHDLLGGIERYATGAKNQIYHIDDIQTLRALRNYIADTFGQGKGLDNLDSLSEEEAQDRIKQVFNSHLSTFAKFLNEEANVIAGKTALIDRGIEGIIGRRGITFLDTINKQVGSNMVGMNVSSSLTNFVSVVQAFAKTNKTAFVKGFAQTVANKVGHAFGKADTFADNPTMLRRQGADRFYRTPWQKIADAGYALMGATDSISTEIIVRSKYNEFIQKGMSDEQAITEADKWASRLMADRSLGQMPQLYNSKMLGLVTKFQLEVRNQLDSQFYDTIQETKQSYEDIDNAMVRNGKTAAKVAAVFFELAVAQHLFGKAFESIAGYNPAFDIIDVLVKALGLDDDEESEDTALDNIEQGFLALLEDLPYTSVVTDGGRIPISSALPIEELVTGKDEYGNEKSRLDTLGEIAPYYLLPTGYGQIKKTTQGLSMFDEDLPIAGSYTDSGNLRFPVEDTLGNRIQAGVFGQWASSNARDYLDNERQPLTEKQIDELVDSEMSIQEYWDYREGLSKYKTLEAKAGYINSLDLTVRQKNLLINNIADRKEDIDMSNYDEFSSFDEFDFYNKNPDMHTFLENNGYSYQDYANADEDGKRAFTWAYENPSKFQVSRAVSGDFLEYYGYKSDINDLSADKDANGKSITGSRKDKVIDYVNSLDIDYGARLILFKSEYPADDDYNVDIINYLDNHPDISYEQMVMILKELGFTVSSDGVVSWD